MAVVDKYIIDVKTQGAKKANSDMNKLSASSKNLAKSIGLAAVAYIGTQGLISAIRGSIQAYSEQEMAERKLQTALGRTSQALLNQASALQRVTTFGDEAIIAQQAFLGSIGFTEEKIKDLIPVALDLASATGQTLEFAVRNLAKTYSGLTGELGELIPQTKELTAEELKSGGALQVIADLMGGSAEENTKTMTGSIEQMKNAIGDAAESIGNLLSPSIIAGSRLLQSMAEALSNAIDGFDKFMGKGSNVVGILSNQEIAMNNFNKELLEANNNQKSLIELQTKVADLRDNEIGSLGLITEKYLLYDQMLQIVNNTIKKVGDSTEETTFRIDKQTRHSQKGHDAWMGMSKVQIAQIKEIDKEEKLYYASSLSGLRNMIKGRLAEMFAGLLSREIGTKGVAGILTASAGAIAANALFEQFVPQFQSGGVVGGNRHSQGGTIIEAEQGEYIMNRNAVSAIGVENLNRMNQGQSAGSNINININGGMIDQDFVENELAESIRTAIRKGSDFFGVS